jgi:hypothetical protein
MMFRKFLLFGMKSIWFSLVTNYLIRFILFAANGGDFF